MRLLAILVPLIAPSFGAAGCYRAPNAPAASGGCELLCYASARRYTVDLSCEKDEERITYEHQTQQSLFERTSTGDLTGRRLFFMEKRTYATSKNAYWIWGGIYVNEIAGRTASYEIRATGGALGSAVRVCRSGQIPMKLPADPPPRWSFVHRVSASYKPSIQVAACDGVNPQGLRTWACLASEKGDFLGQGRTWTYTPAQITASLEFFSKTLNIEFAKWRFTLAPSMEEHWRPELFDSAAKRPGFGQDTSDRPALEVTSEHRACRRSNGQFEVLEFAYDSEKQEVRSLAVNIEHSCDGGPPLRGYIRYNSAEPD
jgi:hypothetical protein